MAGISTKAIKSKMKSMESTRQITKAMELVASSKLRGAQTKAMDVRTYHNTLYDAMTDIASSSAFFVSRFLNKPLSEGRPLYIVIAGDRGLAGGYNGNIFRLADPLISEENAYILPIGKKALEHYRKPGFEIAAETHEIAADMHIGACYTTGHIISDYFLSGKHNSVYICYTKFDSILSQTPQVLKLLPLEFRKKGEKPTMDTIYEGSSEEVFDSLVPEYIGGVIYGCLCESLASEQAARRTAMDSATKNADEMISKLDLQYNRARQAAITQEITEIVAGSES